MELNNIQYSRTFSFQDWNIGKIAELSNGIVEIPSMNRDRRLILIFLTGNTIKKISLLKNIKSDAIQSGNIIIGLYSGLLNAIIKNLCSKNKIFLTKSIIFQDKYKHFIIEAVKHADNSVKSYIPELGKIERTKRNRFEIIENILDKLSDNDLNITSIAYDCKLNYNYCRNTVNCMLEEKLIEQYECGNFIKYKITSLGLAYRQKYKNLKHKN